MFAQLLMGIFFIIRGTVEIFARKPNYFLSKGTIDSIPKENLPIYLKRVGIVHILLGVLFATMGHIEYWHNPEPRIFITIYIVIGLILLGMIVFLNKKYSGNYILRI